METVFITATLLAGKVFFRYSYALPAIATLSAKPELARRAQYSGRPQPRRLQNRGRRLREVRLRDTQAPTPFLELLAKSAAPYSYLPDAECSP